MHLPEERVAGVAKRVGIGESAVGGSADRFRVTLGSCVGLCLVWAQRGRLAVAHVLLPSARDGASKNKKPSRFADTVVPYLLEQLGSPERSREVIAYVAGGGTQFELSSKTASVGEQNRAGVLAALRLARIRVAAEDCGGDLPRQLVVDGPEASVYSIRYAADPEASSWELPHAFKEATTS